MPGCSLRQIFRNNVSPTLTVVLPPCAPAGATTGSAAWVPRSAAKALVGWQRTCPCRVGHSCDAAMPATRLRQKSSSAPASASTPTAACWRTPPTPPPPPLPPPPPPPPSNPTPPATPYRPATTPPPTPHPP